VTAACWELSISAEAVKKFAVGKPDAFVDLIFPFEIEDHHHFVMEALGSISTRPFGLAFPLTLLHGLAELSIEA